MQNGLKLMVLACNTIYKFGCTVQNKQLLIIIGSSLISITTTTKHKCWEQKDNTITKTNVT